MLSFYNYPGEFFNEDEDFSKDIEQAIERAKDTLKTVPETFTEKQPGVLEC